MSGPILRNQSDVSAQVPMPVERLDDTSVSNTSTSETVVWYYLTGGAWAAAVGQAAGTICTAKLTYSGVLNSMGTAGGSYNDTSLSFAAATRAAQVKSVPEDILTKMVFMSPTDQKATIATYLTVAGDYFVDHRRGQVWLNSKATVANDSATYQYATPLSGGSTGDKVDVTKLGGVSINLGTGAVSTGTQRVVLGTNTHTYAETIVGDSASSVTLLAANSARGMATIQNNSSAVMSISKTGTATTSSPIRLEQYQIYELPIERNGDVYKGALTAIWASDAGGSAYVEESTIS